MHNIPDTPEQAAPVYIYPSLVTRYQAAFIDVLVIIILMFAAGYALDYFENPPDWIRIVLFFAIWGVYEPLFTAMGNTMGQYMMKVKVVQFNNRNKKPTVPEAYLRYVLKILLGWLSFLTISSNKDSRALHDLAAGTVVIQKQ